MTDSVVDSVVPPLIPAVQVDEHQGLAWLSLASGLLAWVALPVVAAFVAIISGHVYRRCVRAVRGAAAVQTGMTVSVLGLVLGWLQIALLLSPFMMIALVVLGLFSIVFWYALLG